MEYVNLHFQLRLFLISQEEQSLQRLHQRQLLQKSFDKLNIQLEHLTQLLVRNINIPTNPHPGASYTIITPGEPFQFSETILGPGIAKETQIERTTITDSFSTSISVFTQ